MPKVLRPTIDIDDKFASVVLTNQLNFDPETNRLKRFLLPGQDSYPEDYAFTANLQKYINLLTTKRLELYKHAMRDIESVPTEPISGTHYIRIIESAHLYFRGQSRFEISLTEYLTDICTYTRCAYVKGLKPTKYWPIRYMAEYLFLLRTVAKFHNRTYGELDRFLTREVTEIENETGPMDLKPVELSLEWVNHPVTSSLYLYRSIVDGVDREPFKLQSRLSVTTNTYEKMPGSSGTSDSRVIYEDNLSTHSDTSDNYSGNYYSSDEEDSDDNEYKSRKRRISEEMESAAKEAKME